MNQPQFEFLRAPAPIKVLCVDDLVDKTPRTLLYGYNFDRATWHLYLGADGLMHFVLYGIKKLLRHQVGTSAGFNVNADFVFDIKRFYPECCDFEFCQLLQDRNVSIPFTGFTVRDKASTSFAGLLAEAFEATATAEV